MSLFLKMFGLVFCMAFCSSLWMPFAKKAHVHCLGEQLAASSGSLATYKPENDMSQAMQFLAKMMMNVGEGMNTGSFNHGKGAGLGSQPQAKTLAMQDAPPLRVDDAKREQCKRHCSCTCIPA